MFEEFAKFIAENYPGAGRIVEVGVGHRIEVAVDIKAKLPKAEIIVTDKDESWIRTHRTRMVRAVVDDVHAPRLALYEGAGLIYSLQPPVELVPSLVKLARRVGVDLLVVPVADEQEMFHEAGWRKVVRQGRTVAWLLPGKRKSSPAIAPGT